MARRAVRHLGFDDDLALHALVTGAARFAALERIRSGFGGFDINRHGITLLQFKAIFAEYEREARRCIGLGAVRKGADVQTMRAVGGNNLQADFIAHFQVNYGGIKLEILRRHDDDSRRRLGFRMRLFFLGLVFLRRARGTPHGSRGDECKHQNYGDESETKVIFHNGVSRGTGGASSIILAVKLRAGESGKLTRWRVCSTLVMRTAAT